MEQYLQALAEAVNRWRSQNIESYWWQIDYIGASLNRMGQHTLTFAHDKLWHQWHGEWREIKPGSDFWLYSVPGSFAWARDMLTKVLPDSDAGPDGIDLRFNGEHGYIEYIRVKAAKRDASNFTFEVKAFGIGAHPEFSG